VNRLVPCFAARAHEMHIGDCLKIFARELDEFSQLSMREHRYMLAKPFLGNVETFGRFRVSDVKTMIPRASRMLVLQRIQITDACEQAHNCRESLQFGGPQHRHPRVWVRYGRHHASNPCSSAVRRSNAWAADAHPA
jgi:hypothetical protein